MSKINPRELSLLNARNFIKAIGDSTGPYYVWIGNNVDPSISRGIADDVYYTAVDPYVNMILGKQIQSNDATLLINNTPYVSNVVYSMYDDQDPLLSTKSFYVSTNAGSWTHVFKCLYNNQGSVSTVGPSYGDTHAFDEVYQTSDGYQWKYMFSVDYLSIQKFSTPGYLPLLANAVVTSSARSGAIDVISVVTPGAGYGNWLTGTFSVGDAQIGGNALVFSVGSNTSANTNNGYYTGCVLYLSSGTGTGQYRNVVTYQTNSSGHYVVVDSPFLTVPAVGTQWQINPSVGFVSSGSQTVNAVAMAVINSAGNTVQSVQMLSHGLGYTMVTASVVANAIVGVTNPAAVRPIASPPGGHGYDQASELAATVVGLSVTLLNTEGNTIPAAGQFGQFGVMTTPVFAYANLSFSTYSGIPTTGQTLVSLNRTRVALGATVSPGSNVVTMNTAAFSDVVKVGDLVYVSDLGSNRLLSAVVSVNSGAVVLNTAPFWSSSNATVWDCSVRSTCVISQINGVNTVDVQSLSGPLAVGDEVAVQEGGPWGLIAGLTRGGVSKGQNTFVQAKKLVGSFVSGPMVENEFVYQGSSAATANVYGYVHSVTTNGGISTVYLTRVTGPINVSAQIIGNTSGAVLNMTNKYVGEIVPGSAKLIYIENMNPVERSTVQSEQLVFALQF